MDMIIRSTVILSVMVFTTFVGGAFGGVSIQTGTQPTLLDKNGNPFVARGAVYFQPQAAHNYFLSEVDLEKAAEDFDLFKSYGFNTVALDINWGELITSVDSNYNPTATNALNIAKLKALAQLAEDKGMFVYAMPLTQSVPKGIEAASFESTYDAAGNYLEAFSGFYVKNWMMDPGLNACFLSFMNILGDALAEYENIVCYCFSYESTEQFWPWCHDDDQLIANWRDYLRDTNSDVNYWKQRWNEQGESYTSIDEIILPYRAWAYWDYYYTLKGMDPIESDPLKWRDYFDFMFIEVGYEGNYGMSIPQMAAAIRVGDPDALVMLKNRDPKRYAWELGAINEFVAGTPLPPEVATIMEKKYSYPGLSMIACDNYPIAHTDPAARAEQLSFVPDVERIRDYQEYSPLPIFCQEFGGNHAQWTMAECATYIANALEGFRETKLLGYNVWQSHDFHASSHYSEVANAWGIFDTNGVPNAKANAFLAQDVTYVSFVGTSPSEPWGELGVAANWEGGAVPSGSTTGLVTSAIIAAWSDFLQDIAVRQTGSYIQPMSDAYDGNQHDAPVGEFPLRGGSLGSGITTVYEINDPRTDYASYTNLTAGMLSLWSQFGEKIELSILSGHVEANVLKLVTWGHEGTINMGNGILHAGSNNFANAKFNMLAGGTGVITIDSVEADMGGLRLNFEPGSQGSFTFGDKAGGTAAGFWEELVISAKISIDGVAETDPAKFDITGIGNSATIALPAVPSPAERYEAWAGGQGLVITNMMADPDVDGMDNLTEYALGGNPNIDDAAILLPAYTLKEGGEPSVVQYIYNRRRDAVERGLNYAIIVKTDLIKDQWLSYGTFFETGSAVIDSDFEAVTNEIPTAYFAEGFFNMKVTLD